MSREARLRDILQKECAPIHLEIENESHMHSGNRQESHFKVFIVSAKFEGQSRVERQRMIHSLLASELNSGLHALSMRLLSEPEWRKTKEDAFESPICASKK